MKQELIDSIDRLNEQQQQHLLTYVKNLLQTAERKQRLAELAGTISDEDAHLMLRTIADNRKIDTNEW